jgi:NAD(P)-dependent dehydrogenase (short-subunit alcohol dehydrogenase family)
VNRLCDKVAVTDLAGKVAIITGGAGGIGAVFGRALAEQGASVVLADLDHERAAKVADAIAADGGAATGVGLDVTNPDSTRAVVADTTERWGGLDILINSAALMAEIPFSPLETFPLDWWQRVMAVNLTGPLLCTQAAAPAMAARGGGRVVNMVSAGAFQPAGVYGVSKYALVGLTMNLASQLGAKGITVNAIAPGLVADEAGMRALPEGPIRESIKAPIPLKTHLEGPPEDLVGTLLLLVSAAGGWITGQTISVDGGWVMRF